MADLKASARHLRPGIIPTVILGALPFVLVFALAMVVQMFLFPWLSRSGHDFEAKIAVDVGISIVLAVSLTMVNGFTGQFSIGHAAFMAVGAYTAASIVYYASYRIFGHANLSGGLVSSMISGREGPMFTKGDLLFAASLIAGGITAAGCGYLVGLPSLRLKGDYLAIVTLGFGEIVRSLIITQSTDVISEGSSVTSDHLRLISAWKGLTTDDSITPEHIASVPWYLWPGHVGGGLGFVGLPSYTSLFWVVLVMGVTLVVAFRLKRSSYGRAFLSVREDEIAAESMGVNVTAYKVRAFVLAAFFAGVAGGLFAHTIGVQLNPGELGFQKSFDIIIMVVLGGLGSISGAAIAALVVTRLPEALRKPADLAEWWKYGLALVAAGAIAWIVLRSLRRLGAFGTVLIGFGCVLLAMSAIAAWAIRSDVNLSNYRMVMFALALIAMMIFRPQGLLGVREIWEGALWRDMFRKRPENKRT